MTDDEYARLFDTGALVTPDELLASYAFPAGSIAPGQSRSSRDWSVGAIMAGGQDVPNPIDFIEGLIGGLFDVGDRLLSLIAAGVEYVWQTIGGALRWVYESAGAVALYLFGLTVDAIEGVQGWVSGSLFYVVAFVARRFDDVIDWIGDTVEHARANIVQGAAQVRDAIIGWVASVAGRVGDVWEFLTNDVPNFFRFVITATLNAVDNAVGALFAIGGAVVDQVLDGVDLVFNWISDAAQWVYQNVSAVVLAGSQGIADAFQSAFDFFADRIIGPIVDVFENKIRIPARLFQGEYGSIGEFWDDITDPLPAVVAGLFGTIASAQIVGQTLSLLIHTMVTPLLEPALQRELAAIGAKVPPTSDVIAGWNRGVVDDSTARVWLSRQGYGDQPIELFDELRHPIPTPTDMVRFGVREVYTPEVAERFGQFEDFPPAFGVQMARLGFELEVARQYWAAHWDLPSATQGFEMLHRNVIDMPDLELLLRALDVMPFWRERLIEIAYTPITRIDIRRFYKMGVIDLDEVERRYRFLGYSPADALVQQEFARRWVQESERTSLDDLQDLAAAQIRQGYRARLFTRDEAEDRLVELTYTEDDANFLLDLDDVALGLRPDLDSGVDARALTVPTIRQAYREGVWARSRALDELEAHGYLAAAAELMLDLEDVRGGRELDQLRERIIRDQYREKTITRDDAGAQLSAANVTPARRDLLLQAWDMDQPRAARRLTAAQIVSAYRRDTFDVEGALDELVALGYSERDAGILLDVSGPVLSTAQLFRLWKGGFIDEDQVVGGLFALGYNETSAGLLVEGSRPAAA